MFRLNYISGSILSLVIFLSVGPSALAQHGNHGSGNRGGGSSRGDGGAVISRGNGNGGNLRPARSGVNNYRPYPVTNVNPTTFTPRYNGGGNRTRIFVGINNQVGYRGYGNGYHSYYGSQFSYNYYPRYSYRPIYYSPYAYVHYGPVFGFRLGILPFGYYPFYLGNDPYYYYDGIYYRPYANEGYVVTQPPLGATVNHLPSGAKETTINGQQYYELGGTFYEASYNAKNKLQYVVVGTDGVINQVDESQPVAPAQVPQNLNQNQNPLPEQQQQFVPTNINQLPVNTKIVTIQQQKYYVTPNGIYYKEVISADNTVSYQSVGGLDDSPVQKLINFMVTDLSLCRL